MATLSDSMVSSSARKLAIRKRADLSARRQQYLGRSYWVVKEPVGLNYFRFQDEEFAILQMLDGRISLDEIKERFEAEFPPQKITLEELQQFLGMLHRSGLVIAGVGGQGHQLRKRRDERRRKEVAQFMDEDQEPERNRDLHDANEAQDVAFPAGISSLRRASSRAARSASHTSSRPPPPDGARASRAASTTRGMSVKEHAPSRNARAATSFAAFSAAPAVPPSRAARYPRSRAGKRSLSGRSNVRLRMSSSPAGVRRDARRRG